jgi:hypothetical protein
MHCRTLLHPGKGAYQGVGHRPLATDCASQSALRECAGLYQDLLSANRSTHRLQRSASGSDINGIAPMRPFAGASMPAGRCWQDDSLNFRHLLEKHDPAPQILATINAHLTSGHVAFARVPIRRTRFLIKP